ncbi:MAG TPA: PAS domain-containing protein [Rhizomicrobium sp.]|jgi:hypothetical protein
MPERSTTELTKPAETSRFRHNIPVADVRNPLLLRAIDLWQRQRGDRRFPERSEMTPRVLGGLLRNTVLVRVLDGGRDFEFRIVGDAIVAAQGASFQGYTTAQIEAALPGYGRMLKRVYGLAYETGEPSAFRGWFERGADGRAFFHESLVLPLGTGGVVDHLLILGVYAYSDTDVLR